MRAAVSTDTEVVPPPIPAGSSARECLDVRSVGPNLADESGPSGAPARGVALGEVLGSLLSDRREAHPWLGGLADDLERADVQQEPRR
jgi:hypothetical protein